MGADVEFRSHASIPAVTIKPGTKNYNDTYNSGVMYLKVKKGGDSIKRPSMKQLKKKPLVSEEIGSNLPALGEEKGDDENV